MRARNVHRTEEHAVNVIAAIQALLAVVSLLMKWADEQQLKELGKNELVQQQLTDLVARTGSAKVIADQFAAMSDPAIDEFLRDHYRD